MSRLSTFVSIINNGILLRKNFVLVKRTKFLLEVLKVLYQEGFINGFAISEKNSNFFLISIKYVNNLSFVKKFNVISTFSKHCYLSNNKINNVLLKDGIFLISTSHYGIVTNIFLKQNLIYLKNTGGEILIKIEI
jgi:ribosomal protein S8